MAACLLEEIKWISKLIGWNKEQKRSKLIGSLWGLAEEFINHMHKFRIDWQDMKTVRAAFVQIFDENQSPILDKDELNQPEDCILWYLRSKTIICQMKPCSVSQIIWKSCPKTRYPGGCLILSWRNTRIPGGSQIQNWPQPTRAVEVATKDCQKITQIQKQGPNYKPQGPQDSEPIHAGSICQTLIDQTAGSRTTPQSQERDPTYRSYSWILLQLKPYAIVGLTFHASAKTP